MDISAYIDPVRAWWVVLGFAIPAILGGVFGKLQERAKAATREKEDLASRLDRLEASQRYLLKDRILQACTYWRGRGFCPPHARETIVDMFESYQAHGGNSFVHEEVGSCLDLPHEEGGQLP